MQRPARPTTSCTCGRPSLGRLLGIVDAEADHRAQSEADFAAVLETLGRGQESAAPQAQARETLLEVGAHAWVARLQPVVA
jgi:hypothetical protein